MYGEKDGDKAEVLEVHGFDSPNWMTVVYDKAVACEDQNCLVTGGWSLEDDPQCGTVCSVHLLSSYKDGVRMLEQRRPFVMFWQRVANSGYCSWQDTTLEVVRKAAYAKEHVKTVIVVGRIVDIFGNQD